MSSKNIFLKADCGLSLFTEFDLQFFDVHCALDELLPALEQLLSGGLNEFVQRFLMKT